MSTSKHIAILDTSVILHDANSIFGFDGYDIMIPLVVLNEVDKFRSLDNEVGRNARSFIRSISKMCGSKGKLAEGVKRRESGEELYITLPNLQDFKNLDPTIANVLDLKSNDDLILLFCLGRMADSSKHYKLFTKDISLAAKANVIGVQCEDYYADTQIKNIDTLFTGIVGPISAPGYLLDQLYTDKILDLDSEDTDIKFVCNQVPKNNNTCVTLIDELNPSHTAIALYSNNKLRTFNYKGEKISSLVPCNREQSFAFELLLDPAIKLVTLTGMAGTGKTLLAIACGIHQTMNTQRYDRLLVSRPIQPLGKDIGYLPGPQPLDAKVLTPTGWTTMGEIKPGDFVIAHDGTSAKVQKVFYKGVKPVYKVDTTEGSSTECCLDHLWYTTTAENRKRGKEGSVKTTKQIRDTLKNTLPGKKLNSHNPRYGGVRPNHYIPRNGLIKYDNKDLLIPPYILGCILGDGSISGAISISSVDKDLIDKIDGLLVENNINCRMAHQGSRINYNFSGKYLNNKPAKSVKTIDNMTGKTKIYPTIGVALKNININRGTLHYRCSRNVTAGRHTYRFLPCTKRWQNPIKNSLYLLGLGGAKAWDKFIPEEYLYTSTENRLELLRGLMDTDGTVKKSTGEASFTTTSKKLADGIIELVRSLGGRARICGRDRVGKESMLGGRIITSRRPSYEFTISFSGDINPFYINRKAANFKNKKLHAVGITGINYVGEKEVKCILIDHPDHLYITDGFIVTHNSIEEKLNPWMGPVRDAVEFVFGGDTGKYEEMKSFNWLEIEPLTYIRGRSLPRTLFILDEAQNLTTHEMKTIVSRIGKDSKIILTGDVFQIDNHYLDTTTNGLTSVIEKFKSYDIAGHVTLTKGQRSKLASLAADIL